MKEVFDYIVSLLKSRIFPMILVFIVLISVLVHRLFVLQIIKGDSYVEDLPLNINGWTPKNYYNYFNGYDTERYECCGCQRPYL